MSEPAHNAAPLTPVEEAEIDIDIDDDPELPPPPPPSASYEEEMLVLARRQDRRMERMLSVLVRQERRAQERFRLEVKQVEASIVHQALVDTEWRDRWQWFRNSLSYPILASLTTGGTGATGLALIAWLRGWFGAGP